jgi:ABC-type multidrug transport system fused ATPase/permease subunit
MFWHYGYETVWDRRPLLLPQARDDEDDSESSFVACLVLRPPTAWTGGSCEIQQPSLLPEEHTNFDALCVTGGAALQLDAYAQKHIVSVPSARFWIVFCVVCDLFGGGVAVLAEVLFPQADKEEETSNREVPHGIEIVLTSIAAAVLTLLAMWVGWKAAEYVEARSQRRLTSVNAFRMDMQFHVTQIKDFLQPFGFSVSIQEHHHHEDKDGSINVMIEKSAPYTDSRIPPVEHRETPEGTVQLTRVSASFITHGHFAQNTPLDVWLLGGLMIRMGNAIRTLRTKSSRGCDVRAAISLFTFLVGFFVVVQSSEPFLYFFLLLAFVLLFGNVFGFAVIYYMEYTHIPPLHAAFQRIVQDVSQVAAERVGHTMTYTTAPNTIAPGGVTGYSLGTIHFHNTMNYEEEASDENANFQSVAAVIM